MVFKCKKCGTPWSTTYGQATCCASLDKCFTCGKSKPNCTCCKTCGYHMTKCVCCPLCGNGCSCCCFCQNPCPSCEVVGFNNQKCANCGYKVTLPKIDHYPNKEITVAKRLGLNPDTNLPLLCANYYLLQNMWQIRRFGKAYKMLRDMAEKYTPEFATYLDIACGGEIRHAANLSRYGIEPPPVTNNERRGTRGLAWEKWTTWKDPVKRIEYAKEVFYCNLKKVDSSDEEVEDEDGYRYGYGYIDPHISTPWGGIGGYGGPKWGDIADALLLYLKMEINPIQFLDRVWNLQHNGGVALNKVYRHSGTLTTVLNAHGKDDYKTLLKYASPTVREMWELCDKWVAGYTKEDENLQFELQSDALTAFRLEKELKIHNLDRLTLRRAEALVEGELETHRELMLKAAEAKKKVQYKQVRSPKKRQNIVENYKRDIYLANSFGTGDYTPPLNRASRKDWKGGLSA